MADPRIVREQHVFVQQLMSHFFYKTEAVGKDFVGNRPWISHIQSLTNNPTGH